MGKRGPQARRGLIRENNGRVSRRNVDVHERGDKPYAQWAIYFATTAGMTKVGYSGDVQRRLSSIAWEHKTTMRLTGVVGAASEQDARELERHIHQRLRSLGFHFDGEWFDLANTEVRAELDRLRSEGRTILSGIDMSVPPRIISPPHLFSDAKGSKFAGIAAKAG